MSQSLLRQRILPDGNDSNLMVSAANVSIASSSANTPGRFCRQRGVRRDGQSQSLLRQRILPDPAWPAREHTQPTQKSQSLLRQRILPDVMALFWLLYLYLGLNRFFVSEYSRTDLFSPRPSCWGDKSQSLLRQRILPDTLLDGSLLARVRVSQSLLRQRILPDWKSWDGVRRCI